MKSYKEENLVAKNKKRDIIESRPQGGKNKRARPFIVEYRLSESRMNDKNSSWMWNIMGEWAKMGAYRSEQDAKKVVSDNERKYPDFWEYRIIVK